MEPTRVLDTKTVNVNDINTVSRSFPLHHTMTKYFAFLFCALFLFCAKTSAQTCQINGLNTLAQSIITPTGTSDLCGTANITLPILTFTSNETMPSAGIVWLVYNDQPNIQGSNYNPLTDPAFVDLGLLPLLAEDGNALIGGGTASLGLSSFNFNGADEMTIVIVPAITSDSEPTGPTIAICDGIIANFNYPQFTLHNPCSEFCGGSPPGNDICSSAAPIDLNDLGTFNTTPFDNVCANATGDPSALPGCFQNADSYVSTVWFSFVGDGGNYTIATTNCAGSSNETLDNTQMTLFTGACNNLIFAACADNENGTLAVFEDFPTECNTQYFLLVDGYNEQQGEFCFSMTQTVVPPCNADAGTLLYNGANQICDGAVLEIEVNASANPNCYASILLITNLQGNVLASQAPGNISLPVGNYLIYSLNYLLADETDVFDAIQDGNSIDQIRNLINTDAVCADLNTLFEALPIIVQPTNDPDCTCLADTGIYTPTESETLCEDNSLNFGATGNNNPDYTTIYVITDQNDNVIVFAQNQQAAANAMGNSGNYAIHVLNIANEDMPLPTLPINLNALQNVLQGQCYDLQFGQNLSIIPSSDPDCTCLANAGTYIGTGSESICAGQAIAISVSGNNQTDYTTYFVVADQNGNIIDIAPNAAAAAAAMGSAGNYVIYVLNIADEDTMFLEQNPVNITALQNLLQQPDICADLLQGQTLEVLPSTAVVCFCEANISAFSYEGATEFCSGTASGIFTITGTQGDYTSALLIDFNGDEEGGDIDAIMPVGSIDLSTVEFGIGQYYVWGINYFNQDINTINQLIAGGINVQALSDSISTLQLCASIAVPVNVITLLDPTVPPCSNQCFADAGVFELPSQTDFCANTALTFNVNNDAQGDYTTYFVLADAFGNILLQPNTSGTFTLGEGSYVAYTLNIKNEDADALLPLSLPQTLFGWATDLGNFEACYEGLLSGYAFDVLPALSPQCFNCEASTGTVTYPTGEDLLVCEGATAPPILVVGNTQGDYTTLFVLVNAGFILNYSESNAIDFAGYPSGNYTVYVLNYANAYQNEVMQVLNSSSGQWSLVEGFVAQGSACAVLDLGSVTFTVVQGGMGNCLFPVIVTNVQETIANDLLTYTVTFNISGGSGNYMVDGTPIFGDVFTSEPIPCGTPYSFEVTDNVQTNIVIVDNIAPCAKVCITQPGTMPDLGGNALICYGDETDYATSGEVLGEGDALVYILHSDPNAPLDHAIAINSNNGGFSLNSSPDVLANTVYYVAAVAGPTGAGGGILWDDECTKVSNGVPVVFLNPISFDIDEYCDREEGVLHITVLVTGGIPEFVPSETYSISGDFNGAVAFGEDFSFSMFEQATSSYSLFATDGTCTGSETRTFECVKSGAVDWLSFKGNVLPQGNQLLWQTASEQNNDRFEVQMSENGRDFKTIGWVDAVGNSTVPSAYSFVHDNSPDGLNYYRILAHDDNGKITPSNVLPLYRQWKRLSLTRIQPVPARQDLNVSFNAPQAGTVDMRVYDMTGKMLESRSINVQAGMNILDIDVRLYAQGMYLLSLTDANGMTSDRFLVGER